MPDGRCSHTSCLLRAWLYPAICFHNLHTSKSSCCPCINKGDCSIALLHFADGCSKTGSPISSTPLTAFTPMLSPRDATMLLKPSSTLHLAFVISPTSVLAFYRLRILTFDKESSRENHRHSRWFQSVKEAPLPCSSGASSMRKAGSGRKAATCGWQVS